MSRTPIADYALLSDCRSAALVSSAGSIDWLCFPRFDGQSVFGRILGEDAGHWSIRPSVDFEVTRKYRERTLVLETTFRTPGGQVTLVDAMDTGSNEDGHKLGARADHVVLRRITCDRGEVALDIEYAPRTEYGLIHPVMANAKRGVVARGGADLLALSSPVPMTITDDSRAMAQLTLRKGDSASFALHRRASWEKHPRYFDEREVERRVEETTKAWLSWSESHQNYDGPWRDLVYHSGSVLQGLTF